MKPAQQRASSAPCSTPVRPLPAARRKPCGNHRSRRTDAHTRDETEGDQMRDSSHTNRLIRLPRARLDQPAGAGLQAGLDRLRRATSRPPTLTGTGLDAATRRAAPRLPAAPARIRAGAAPRSQGRGRDRRNPLARAASPAGHRLRRDATRLRSALARSPWPRCGTHPSAPTGISSRAAPHGWDEHHGLQRRSRRPRLRGAPVIEPGRRPGSGCCHLAVTTASMLDRERPASASSQSLDSR